MKYQLLQDDTKLHLGRKLYRIRALAAITALGIAVGDLGGYVEKEANLSQNGNAWVSGDAWVYGDARVSGDAQFGWFSHVGSEGGTLTWYLTANAVVQVNRGCFNGTLEQFASANEKTHGDSPIGQQYRLLIQFIELRAAEALKEYNQ